MVPLRVRRLLLWVALPVAVLVLLYAAFGFLLVPRLIRSQAQDFVARTYHRTLQLGEVRFNPFTLRLDIRDLSLPDSDGQPMLSFRHLLVDLTVASIWRRGPDFETILLEEPYARVLIKPDGSLNLSELAPPPATPPPPPEPNPKPVRLFINHFSVAGGNVSFEDRAHPSAFRTEIKPITFQLDHFSTVGRDGGTYELSGTSEAGEHFSWAGSVSPLPLASRGRFEVENLQAQTLWSYIRDSVQFELPAGTISLHGDYDFTTATTPIGLAVGVQDVTVADLAIRPKGTTENYVKLARLEVRDTHADVDKRTVTIGSVHLSGGDVRAWVQTGGKVNLLELAGPTPSATASAGPDSSASPNTAVTPASAPTQIPAAGASASASAPPSGSEPGSQSASGSNNASWTVSVPEISLDGWKISAEDRQVSPAATLLLEDLNVHVTGFSTARSTPLAVALDTKLNHTGKLDVKADLSPDYSAVKAQAQLDALDLTALQPYIAQRTSMTLLSGALSTKLAAERAADGHLTVHGDAGVAKLKTVDNALKQDFIKFERLQASGIDYNSAPASLHIHSIDAHGPYARVIVESDRSVNVAKILRAPGTPEPAPTPDDASDQATTESSTAAPTATATASAAATAPSPGAAPSGAPAASGEGAASPSTESDGGSHAATARNDTSSSGSKPKNRRGARGHAGKGALAPQPDAGAPALAIAIDAIHIYNGSANYADYWIQPNFAVGIQALGGSILGLSSNPSARAKVELQGKVDRYAPVHIWGEINPLAATAYTDIKMSFKGVDMTSVTPYSGHFAGYKIEKGKLSVDIGYKIDHRKLEAQHRVVIDQLELGERVESPDAIKLPLKIAIALLKDRNGVIDLDLPVTGSLDDPKFKLGPLIWKAVLGLLTKIATAPFALIGHLFGGGEQMNFIEFAPGSAELDPAQQQKLQALVKALQEKTQLQLDVPVTYAADLDRPGLAAARLNERLLALGQGQGGGRHHGKGAAAAGAETATAPPAALTDPAQRFRLLIQLYRSDLGKDTPLPQSAQAAQEADRKKTPGTDYGPANSELEAALLAKITVADGDLESLGKQRAQAIQDMLLGGGQIDPSRVFVIGSQAQPAAAEGKVRVELGLK